MGEIYFDESLQAKAGFIVGAYVYSNASLDEDVAGVLRRAGMTPGAHEFKSSARMDGAPHLVQAREEMFALLSNDRKIGVLVAPYGSRPRLGEYAIEALAKLATANELLGDHLKVFFDEGLFRPREVGTASAERVGLPDTWDICLEQDSKEVLGLQMADLVAHTAGGMLLSQMRMATKTVKAGENSGYDPDDEVPLDFELWARLRWSFFHGGPVGESDLDLATMMVRDFGFFCSPDCSSTLAEAADRCFGTAFRGCIH